VLDVAFPGCFICGSIRHGDERGSKLTITDASYRILVVDDDYDLVEYLCEELSLAGFETIPATSSREARHRVEDVDVVVSDVRMPGLSGLELMEHIRATSPRTVVVLMTGYATVDLAVEAMKRGASDFVSKPFTTETLVERLQVLLQRRASQDETPGPELVTQRNRQPDAQRTVREEPVAVSAAMQQVLDFARRAAQARVPVLLTGESGVGKGEIARWIHLCSPESSGPFVAVNCASLPANLLEAELFGARRGAYTGLHEDRQGLFAAADRGTIFLDEIGEIPVELQARLLHVLERQTYRRLGETRERHVHTRIVAATNRDPLRSIQEGTLRADLYYRLQVVHLDIPPLRSRPEDIPVLVARLIERASARLGRGTICVAPETMALLRNYSWPGNVRELSNAIERALLFAANSSLQPSDFGWLAQQPSSAAVVGFHVRMPLSPEGMLTSDGESRRRHMQRVFETCGGNLSLAARELGIDRKTLRKWLRDE